MIRTGTFTIQKTSYKGRHKFWVTGRPANTTGKWDDVSTLDVFALAKNAEKWPNIAQKLKKFQKLVEERRLYL